MKKRSFALLLALLMLAGCSNTETADETEAAVSAPEIAETAETAAETTSETAAETETEDTSSPIFPT